LGALCFTDYAHRDGNVPGLVWHVLGAGLISDSFQYTASARNFARSSGISLPYGDGELEPMTKYPPLFPVFLAFFEIAGGSSLQGARILNILLFWVNIFYVAMLDVLYGPVIVVSKAWMDRCRYRLERPHPVPHAGLFANSYGDRLVVFMESLR
jgi:hypothetical protein